MTSVTEFSLKKVTAILETKSPFFFKTAAERRGMRRERMVVKDWMM